MSSAVDTEELRIASGDLDLVVSRWGGAIRRAEFRGRAFMLPRGGPDGAMASFPLVPFANRVENNSMTVLGRDYSFRANTADPLYLHGDGWLGLWSVTQHEQQHLTLKYEHKAGRVSPYSYDASQSFSVSGARLDNRLSLTNRGDTPLPFGLGFHPFFPLTPNATLMAPASRFWTERPGHLPDVLITKPEDLDFAAPRTIPDRWINNAFDGWTGKASIRWPELALDAEIEADDVFGTYMIYTPGSADFFCFEPMSHLPNGHHMADFGGLTLLAPGESLAGRLKISLSAVER
ncbi:aldose 1-epimerase [Rhizobium sp. LjRoot258]|uniref:aldose 1-epimerase n=1 Tax=Rhizobium sp. LjRoot258 TaxID=3342299 RepID=UPI003ECFC6D1